MGSIWTFASPLMSIPDEAAHTIKAAAVVRGQFHGTSTGLQGQPLTVTVPGYIANLNHYNCFATQTSVTPACAPAIDGSDRGPHSATTSAGNYNPVYYAIVGMGSRGLTGEVAVYAMRLMSTWLTAFFLAATISAASSFRRFQMPTIAASVAFTPAVFFLTGAVNPNALEIACTGAFFVNLCLLFEQSSRHRPRMLYVGAMTLAGVLLANTRPLSLLWLGLAVFAAVLTSGTAALVRVLKDRTFRASVLLVGVSSIFSLWWSLSARSFESLFSVTPPMPSDEAALLMLDRTVGYMREYVGVLGSLDTAPPVGAVYAWVLGYGVILFLSFTSRPARGRYGVGLLAASVVLVPVALQAGSSERLGWIWQGRYVLALVVTLILASGLATRFHPWKLTPGNRSRIRWGIVLGALAHAYLMLEGLRRYTVGEHGDHINWTEMFEPRWQPPGTWQALALAYILLLAIGSVFFYRLLTSPPSQRTGPAPGARSSSEGRGQLQRGQLETAPLLASGLPEVSGAGPLAAWKVRRQESIETRAGSADL